MDKRFIIEKDYIDEKTGKRCLVVFNVMGVRCAYVEVHNQIPLSVYYEKFKFTDTEVDVTEVVSEALALRRKTKFRNMDTSAHGGITFADTLECVDEKTKFVGIDFAHYSDARDLDAFKKYFGTNNTMYTTLIKLERLKNGVGKVATLEDVEAELKLLLADVYKYEQSELKRLKVRRTYKWRHRDNRNKNKVKYRG